MMSGKSTRPLLATWLIYKLNLYPLIWKIPVKTDGNAGLNPASQTGLGHGNAYVTGVTSDSGSDSDGSGGDGSGVGVELRSLLGSGVQWQVCVYECVRYV